MHLQFSWAVHKSSMARNGWWLAMKDRMGFGDTCRTTDNIFKKCMCVLSKHFTDMVLWQTCFRKISCCKREQNLRVVCLCVSKSGAHMGEVASLEWTHKREWQESRKSARWFSHTSSLFVQPSFSFLFCYEWLICIPWYQSPPRSRQLFPSVVHM